MPLLPITGLLVLLLSANALANQESRTRPAHLIHLPGVGGELAIDHTLLDGLKAGGFNGTAEIFDWTPPDKGLDALWARKHNREQAKILADKITKLSRARPDMELVIVAHSGGNGPMIWSLEQLPDDVQVDTVLMLASALSPEYDLTRALRHVKRKVYHFSCIYDSIILGVGTKMFGTIDGKKTESAGMLGFTRPPAADKEQYKKLIEKNYDKRWMRYGHIGDHIGMMSETFAAVVLAPLIGAAGLDPNTIPPVESSATRTTTQIAN